MHGVLPPWRLLKLSVHVFLCALAPPLGPKSRLDGSTLMLNHMCLPCRLATGGRHPGRHRSSSFPRGGRQDWAASPAHLSPSGPP